MNSLLLVRPRFLEKRDMLVFQMAEVLSSGVPVVIKETFCRDEYWEPVLLTPPNANPTNKFIRRANNIDSGRPIYIGREYQASIPSFIGEFPTEEYIQKPNLEILCWSSSSFEEQSVPDDLLQEYCRLSKHKHGFEFDQALQFLHAYEYNIAEAFNHMCNFKAVQRHKWSQSHKLIFEIGYQFHGRDFASIQNLLKEKSISEVVEFYYIVWKRKRKTLCDIISLTDYSETEEPWELKSPASDVGEVKGRKAKRNAMVKVTLQKQKLMMKNRKHVFANDLCTFTKSQLRDLNKAQNHPAKTRDTIEKLQLELLEALDEADSILKTLPMDM